MSENTEQQIEEQAGIAAHAESGSTPSLLQRLRLPLIIAGVALGLIGSLLLGVVLGSTKLKSERKLYASQVEAFKHRLSEQASERKLLEAKVEGLRASAESQQRDLESLRSRIACFEAAASQASAAEQEELQTQLLLQKLQKQYKLPTQSKSEPKAGQMGKTGYIRYGNSTCTLIAGKSEEWKACLKLNSGSTANSTVAPPTGKAEAVAPAAKATDSHSKTADPHAKPAH